MVDRAMLAGVVKVAEALDRIGPSMTSLFQFGDDRVHYAVKGRVAPQHEGLLEPLLQGRSFERARIDNEDRTLGVGLLGDREQCDQAQASVAKLQLRRSVTTRIYPEHRLPEVNLWWCDVTSGEADKSTALLRVVRDLDQRRPIVLLADGANDIGLASVADLVLAPVWADSGLMARATVIPGASGCAEFVEAAHDHIVNLAFGR